MAGRLLRRLRRNAGSVVSILVRDVLLRGKNLLGLAGVAVGLVALAQGVGALLAGALVSTAVFGLIGGAALYGGTQSFLGSPLKGAGVFLVGLLLIGGGAHALGVGPADTSTDDPTENADVAFDDSGSQASEWTEDGNSQAQEEEGSDVQSDGDDSGYGMGCSAPNR